MVIELADISYIYKLFLDDDEKEFSIYRNYVNNLSIGVENRLKS